jgi:hypothetical protein
MDQRGQTFLYKRTTPPPKKTAQKNAQFLKLHPEKNVILSTEDNFKNHLSLTIAVKGFCGHFFPPKKVSKWQLNCPSWSP